MLRYLSVLLASATFAMAGIAAFPSRGRIELKAKPKSGHLQDVWYDGNGFLYWAHTGELFRTDLQGNVLASVEVGGHHAGLEVRNGRLYTAVCAYNGEPRDETTPESHVMIGEYDAETLKLVEMHVLDINDRSGSLTMLPDGSFYVGCLRPKDITERQVRFHHIGRDFKLIKTHVIDDIPVKLGIETLRRFGDKTVLFVYGTDKCYNGLGYDVIVLDGSLQIERRGLVPGGNMGFVLDGMGGVWTGATAKDATTGTYASALKRLDEPPYVLKGMIP